jgi:hypothetical protein
MHGSVRNYRRLAVREMTEEIAISDGLYQGTLIEDLKMKCFSKVRSGNADTGAERKPLLCGF